MLVINNKVNCCLGIILFIYFYNFSSMSLHKKYAIIIDDNNKIGFKKKKNQIEVRTRGWVSPAVEPFLFAACLRTIKLPLVSFRGFSWWIMVAYFIDCCQRIKVLLLVIFQHLYQLKGQNREDSSPAKKWRLSFQIGVESKVNSKPNVNNDINNDVGS